jgi:SAM-dependent methyltransferase
VIGLDLSEQNIEHARQYENEKLRFFVHDMRLVWKPKTFDIVLNMFTSFGYFETKHEHQEAISAVAKSLKPGGRFVLDFLNPYKVIYQLVPEEIKKIDGIEFHISKYVEDQHIIKEIEFEHEGKIYDFKERVKAIRRSEFLEYFEHADFKVLDIFGDYMLNPYIAETSDRMIFILQK